MNKAIVFMLLGVLLVSASGAHAAAGDLDSTFGQGGLATTRFANDIIPADAVLQPDGRIVVAAGFDNTSAATESFGLVRLLANGRLDRSFGRRGVAMTNFTDFINSPSAMARQPDGKLIVVGNAMSADGTLSEFAIARFNTNGTLDTGFGSGGKVTTNFVGVQPGGVRNQANVVLVMPNGQILVAGLASQCAKCEHDTALARYNIDGSLDTSFGTGGLVRANAVSGPNALALLSNGDILALNGSAIAEFTSTGTLVTVASTTQGATIVGASHILTSMFEPTGQFIFAGAAQGPLGRHDVDIQVSRFAPLGNIDRSFNSPVFDFGMATVPLTDAVQTVAIQPNGQIVVAGLSAPSAGADVFGVARLNADGNLDGSFGNSGTLTTTFSSVPDFSFCFVDVLALQPDGKIVAIGITGNHSGQTFLSVARYLGS